MNSINLVDMKIFQTILLCTSVLAVYSTGPNLSVFESKMRGGRELSDPDRLPFVVTIYTRNPLTRIYGMGSFYNGRTVITSKYCAEKIKGDEGNYFVKGGKRVGYREFNISRAKYTSAIRSEFSSSYGILRLTQKADLGEENPVEIKDITNLIGNKSILFTTVGYGSNDNDRLVLKFLFYRTVKYLKCLKYFSGLKRDRLPLTSEVCAHSYPNREDSLTWADSGAPLYMEDNQLVAVADYFDSSARIYTLFSLLADHVKRIDIAAEPSRRNRSGESISNTASTTPVCSTPATPTSTLQRLKSLNFRRNYSPSSTPLAHSGLPSTSNVGRTYSMRHEPSAFDTSSRFTQSHRFTRHPSSPGSAVPSATTSGTRLQRSSSTIMESSTFDTTSSSAKSSKRTPFKKFLNFFSKKKDRTPKE